MQLAQTDVSVKRDMFHEQNRPLVDKVEHAVVATDQVLNNGRQYRTLSVTVVWSPLHPKHTIIPKEKDHNTKMRQPRGARTAH